MSLCAQMNRYETCIECGLPTLPGLPCDHGASQYQADASKFTDKDAAVRLLNRLSREIANYIDEGDTGSAEELTQERAIRYLTEVADGG